MKTDPNSLGRLGRAHRPDQVVRFGVVDNEQDLMKAFLVRAIVYMHEQNCPFTEEFDRNDFAATQILGLDGEEPVATARIRYFGEFAKLERLAIRPQYRGNGLGHELLSFLLDFCAEKGYRRVVLYAQKHLRDFYEQYGFRVLSEEFTFSDYDYVEMEAELSPHPSSVSREPMTLNRPEGHWHVPGPLESPQRADVVAA